MTVPQRSRSRHPWWKFALSAPISVVVILVLLPPTLALNVYVAWRRHRLRRAALRQWRGEPRFIVCDDHAWGSLLHERWLPERSGSTIVLDRRLRGDAPPAELTLARELYVEYALHQKLPRPPVAVVVQADGRAAPLSFAEALAASARGDHALMERRFDELAALGTAASRQPADER